MAFGENFVWGAATSSYQIEGAWDADGKGPSVWDMMCRKPKAIWHGQNGRLACDHYHRFGEDVGLMADIGLKAYRFSLSWPRIMPEGEGRVNEAGLAFYDRLVDALLERGITPWATLFHWDFPYALYCRGGWLNDKSPAWFEDYTRVVVDRLSDRVTHWMTLNEPQVFMHLGHQEGIHAPGDKLGFAEILRATHHVLLAHGRSARVIRERAKQRPRVGWAPSPALFRPASESPEDIAATREATFAINALNVSNNTWWSDPAVFGRYPEDGLRLFGDAVPKHPASDMELICQPLDFYGINIYSAWVTFKAKAGGGWEGVAEPDGAPRTLFDWPVTPDALYWGPKWMHERYQLPIVITENGLSGHDWVALDGSVRDGYRIDFLERYLRNLRRASDEGVPVEGYFHWSLLDNFEWAEGYKHRFGLIHVDFQTQKRTLKDSALGFRDLIARVSA